MKRFLIHLVINTVALYAAVAIMNGNGIVPQSTNWLAFIWLALIFGLVNAILRPLLSVLSCPLIILTLGLGTLLINTLMFYLAGLIGRIFGVGFTVNGFLPAFLGALIVSIISLILSLVFRETTRKN
ncbi:MAG: phage holin family protein [Anaerolineaceae bacterium]